MRETRGARPNEKSSEISRGARFCSSFSVFLCCSSSETYTVKIVNPDGSTETGAQRMSEALVAELFAAKVDEESGSTRITFIGEGREGTSQSIRVPTHVWEKVIEKHESQFE